MKKLKKIGIILAVIVLVIVGGGFIMFRQMGKKTTEALSKQVNVAIDMNQVKDGTYQGSSDGGMVQAEVEVEVKDHTITNIKLIRHRHGTGKPAEVIIDDMVEQNTDDVDGVSGSTISSKTIRNAVNVALQKGMK